MEYVNIRVALAEPRSTKKNRGRKVAIYALVDVRDGGVRYVGMTRGTLANRLRYHFESPTNREMRAWLGNCPKVTIVLLEWVRGHRWEEAERGWIAWFRERGRLLNVQHGGKYLNPTTPEYTKAPRPRRPQVQAIPMPAANTRASALWRRLYRPMGPAN